MSLTGHQDIMDEDRLEFKKYTFDWLEFDFKKFVKNNKCSFLPLDFSPSSWGFVLIRAWAILVGLDLKRPLTIMTFFEEIILMDLLVLPGFWNSHFLFKFVSNFILFLTSSRNNFIYLFIFMQCNFCQQFRKFEW